MTVIATCRDCDDRHPLGDRVPDDETPSSPVCPHCGSPSYRTQSTSDRIVKSEAERITDAVEPVHGVGEKTRRNIVATFGTYGGLVSATTDELTAIEGVGKQTATRIRDRLEGSE